MEFRNRADAGRQLADVLRSRRVLDPVIVGIARGGVPVAAEVARLLGAPLEICVVRELVADRSGIGAIAEHGAVYLDAARMEQLGVVPETVHAIVTHETAEVARLGALLRDRPAIELRGRNVILVDDAAITGATIRAAARSLRESGVRSLELAIPVGAAHVLEALRPELDRLTCLVAEPMVVAAGARYAALEPVSDAEVVDVLARAHRERAAVEPNA